MNQAGTLVVVSAPSGGGKNAVIRELTKLFSNSTRFITTTTREPREREVDGVDYHFVTAEQFKDMIEKGELLEYNFYAGNYYGSEKKRLEDTLQNYTITFSTLDVNGKKQLDALNFPHISIFLLPESIEILRERIESRGGLTPEEMDMRMHLAEEEVEVGKTYDFPIVNQDGDMRNTVQQIQKFLEEKLNLHS